MPPTGSHPVFLDPGGARWRRWRRGLVALGIVSTLLALTLVAVVLVPPFPPQLRLGAAGAEAGPVRPHFAGTRLERERALFKRRMAYALGAHPVPAARHGRFIPVAVGRTASAAAGAPGRSGARRPIVAAFYVSWDDNSLASFARHAGQLDWVVCEWSFLSTSGDSALDRVDRRLFAAMDTLPLAHRPALFLMVSNFDPATKRFSQTSLRGALTDPAKRARVVAGLRDMVVRNRLAGVTIDLEDVPPALAGAELDFARALRAALAPTGARLTAAIPVSAAMDLGRVQQLAEVCDYVFPMVFDEHYGGGEPGPVASQEFYASSARAVLSVVPARKVVLMVGAYGYNWNDAAPRGAPGSAEAMTFQETMRAAREHRAATRWDPVARNPYVEWTDPDSVDHVVWFLDGATAYDEVRVGDSLGVAGQAVWRLGDEDAGVWAALARRPASALDSVPPGYDVEFGGDGEILHIAARPTTGRRVVHVDAASGLVDLDSIVAYPSPYRIDRYGASAHRVALTFDDGPDGRWTAPILDTLAAYHAPATFFVIGENADAHIPLVRRIYADGHEIGNHTYWHPNLALASPARTRLELDATARMIEAAIGRRSAFFRPPYFGDATPTTADELDPVSIATDRGYYTIGVRDDAEDWQPIPVSEIVRNTIAGRDSGNIVLLHDGGGDRSRTVAALGPLIDSLRARGDTLVLVSQLVGISRDEAMPPLAPLGQVARYADLVGFAALGGAEWLLYWVFMVAVVLGIARLLVIGPLAVLQRTRRHQTRGGPVPHAPGVSVIVPAYNEGRVIIGTVASLLGQRYDGDLEVIVVDDGSTDDTLAVARDAFGDEPRVTVLTKENAGKASALNFGIARARHDVIVGLDADTLFAPDTVAELVQPLADPRVGAVAGNAKVGNRVNIVTRWQALEYVTSQNFDRRAFALVDGITVVPGAVGAWRRDVVRQVGGFRHDTMAEDQDLTLAVRRAGYSIAYADGAVAYTEAPDTLRALAKQRFRWSFGTLQCAWKHRDALFRPRHGTLGFVALPNTWLFQLLLPAVSPIADLMFVFSLVSVWLDRQAHGATYALVGFEQVMTFYAVFLLVDWLAAVLAFLMEPGEEKRLTWLVFIQRFAYRQVMYWVVLRAFQAAIAGRVHGWGKLERKATVHLPAS